MVEDLDNWAAHRSSPEALRRQATYNPSAAHHQSPELVESLRRVCKLEGWQYIKDIGFTLADQVEGNKIPVDKERLEQGALFRKCFRMFIEIVERAANEPAPMSRAEKDLYMIFQSQPILEVTKETEAL